MSPSQPTQKATTTQPQPSIAMCSFDAAGACTSKQACIHNKGNTAARIRGGGAGKDCCIAAVSCFLCFECCKNACECCADVICCPCEACC